VTTLTRFLIEEQRRSHPAGAGFTALVNDVRLACKRISTLIGKGALNDVLGGAGAQNVQGETQQKLDVLANEIFVRTNEWGGQLAGLVSEEMAEPYSLGVSARALPAAVRPPGWLIQHRCQCGRGQHLLGAALSGWRE
jgi:fructose-1,6-bisphosphatase I/sedoheptulose-1,7-bisphosphatase